MTLPTRKNLLATISPTPYAAPLLLDLVLPYEGYRFFLGVAVSGVFLRGKGGAGAPYSYSLVGGTLLPTGLSLDGTTGEITGTPTLQAVWPFVAEVEDSASNVFDHGFTINVESGLFVLNGAPTPGEESVAYQFQFWVVDAGDVTITSGFTVSVGTLPDGLSMNGAGLVTGTPTNLAVGVTWVTVNCTSGGGSIDIPCSFTIYPALTGTLVGSDPIQLYVGIPFSEINAATDYFDITGGAPPYRFVWTNLATYPWLDFNYGSNEFSGIPPGVFAAFDVTGTVFDSIGVSVSGIYVRFAVNAPQNSIQPQNNSSNVGAAGASTYNFVDGNGTTADVTNTGGVVTVKYDATGAGVIRARLATAAALPTNVYNNGSSGVGATLTGVSVGVLTVDGVAVALNDVLLIKDEAAPANNGAYVVTTLGTIGIAYVLTRDTRMDGSTEFTGVLVTTGPEGSTNPDTIYECTAIPPITVGTTAITFQSSGSTYTPPVTTKGDLFGFSTVPARVPVGSNGLPLLADSTNALGVSYGALPASGIGPNLVVRGPGCDFWNGNIAITGTLTDEVPVPYGGTITGWTIVGDQTGSVSIAVSHSTYSAYDTMTSLFTATTSSAKKSNATSLSFAIAAGDVLRFIGSGFSGFTRCTIVLTVAPS